MSLITKTPKLPQPKSVEPKSNKSDIKCSKSEIKNSKSNTKSHIGCSRTFKSGVKITKSLLKHMEEHEKATRKSINSINSIDGLFLSFFPSIRPWIGVLFAIIHVCFYCAIATVVKVVKHQEPEIESNHILMFR